MSELKIVERSLTPFGEIKVRECFLVPNRNKRDLFFKVLSTPGANAVNLSSGLLVMFTDTEEVVNVTAKLEVFPSSVWIVDRVK